jgi:hypothetical protein
LRQNPRPTTTAIRAGLAALVVMLGGALLGPAASDAGAEALVTDPNGAASPVLWNGGVAWLDVDGVHGIVTGSPMQVLAAFKAGGGLSYHYGLDSGTGPGSARHVLAYGFEEINEQTPPMGPGDTEVPTPAIPYETAVVKRGVVGADGHVTALPGCAAEGALFLPVSTVSLAGETVAYGCGGSPLGVSPPPDAIAAAYIALGSLGDLDTANGAVPGADGPYQLSGEFFAYETGEPLKTGKIVVENRATRTVSYEIPQSSGQEASRFALQDDGTLVLLGEGTSKCTPATPSTEQAYPAEWFSVASPAAHQLGCFYDGALRPVGGQWVALTPGPGSKASLVLIELASGSSTTLAMFPNAGVFEPTQQPLEPGADFDGKQLAWTQQSCAGTILEYTPDVATMTPGPVSSTRCPVVFHVPGRVHVGANRRVRLGVSCPLGCTFLSLSISEPSTLEKAGPTFYLPASSKVITESLRLSRKQLAYLRRRGRVKVTLSGEAPGLGSALITTSRARVTLVR